MDCPCLRARRCAQKAWVIRHQCCTARRGSPGVRPSSSRRPRPNLTLPVTFSSRTSLVNVEPNRCPAMGGLQIPRWLGSDPLSSWWLGLAPATLEFWVRFPNQSINLLLFLQKQNLATAIYLFGLGTLLIERNQGKQAHPVLKYRVPHGSQPRHGWAPDPPMVGIRSPIGLAVGSCTSHPGVLGSIPKREEPGKTGAPCVKVPGSSRVPAPPWVGSRSPDGWDQIPYRPGGWVFLGVLGSIPKREEPGKTDAPCVKVPGSSRVPLVVSHSTCPPLSSSPHTHSFVLGTAVINTHSRDTFS